MTYIEEHESFMTANLSDLYYYTFTALQTITRIHFVALEIVHIVAERPRKVQIKLIHQFELTTLDSFLRHAGTLSSQVFSLVTVTDLLFSLPKTPFVVMREIQKAFHGMERYTAC
jgi:hypothetical protein